jgi:hypothetical protein
MISWRAAADPCLRAILIAASLASVPLLQKKTRSRPNLAVGAEDGALDAEGGVRLASTSSLAARSCSGMRNRLEAWM